jgi:hypothetical protein
VHPTDEPTSEPTSEPTTKPTTEPTTEPTNEPTVEPSAKPSGLPFFSPTFLPTVIPSHIPSVNPTISPSQIPTVMPSDLPTFEPTITPSSSPSISLSPVVVGQKNAGAAGFTTSPAGFALYAVIAVLVIALCLFFLYHNKRMRENDTNKEILDWSGKPEADILMNLAVGPTDNPALNSGSSKLAADSSNSDIMLREREVLKEAMI